MKLFYEYLIKLNKGGHEIAVVDGDEKYLKSYSVDDVRKMCVTISDKLEVAKENERVAIIMDNNIYYIAAFLAAIYNGYTVVGINNNAS